MSSTPPPPPNATAVANPPSSASGPRFSRDEQAVPSTKGGRLIGGKFRVIRELGHGGMGAVYEVLHEITHHRRALKLLKKTDNEEHVLRLLREASAAGRIGNAHIVETYDAGRLDSGEAYVLMELLEGDTLFDYIRKKGGASIPELIELVCQACEGLHAAHEHGIVHRDIKPGNLFVTTRDGAPFVKVLDFGISKFDVGTHDMTELTCGGELLGTPAYMAPEQLRRGVEIDRRADIYALGVTLYAACAGVRPFRGTVTELALAIIEGAHTPLWEACTLPRSLCEKIERAMAKDRIDRYPTAMDLARALREELDETSLGAGETMPPSERSQREIQAFLDRKNKKLQELAAHVTPSHLPRQARTLPVDSAPPRSPPRSPLPASGVPQSAIVTAPRSSTPVVVDDRPDGRAARTTRRLRVAVATAAIVGAVFAALVVVRTTKPSRDGRPIPSSLAAPGERAQGASLDPPPTDVASSRAAAEPSPVVTPPPIAEASAPASASAPADATSRAPRPRPASTTPRPKTSATFQRDNPY